MEGQQDGELHGLNHLRDWRVRAAFESVRSRWK